jgi:hypothetical protein
MARTPKQIALTKADISLQQCMARFAGMKIRAQLDPPIPAQGGFPYPARTCAEWDDHEVSPEDLARDAEQGSTALRVAILRMVA